MNGSGGLALVVTSFVLFSLGLAPVITIATDLIVGSAPPERAGAASAISETGAELAVPSGSRSSAASASPSTAASSRTPSPPACHTSRRRPRGTRSAARPEVAARLPAELGGPLLATARDAFTQGLEVAVVSGTVVLAALAVVTALVLRYVRVGAAGAETPEPAVELG